jgi:hypothetical protein
MTAVYEPKLVDETWNGVLDLFNGEKKVRPVLNTHLYKGLHTIPAALTDLSLRKTHGKVIVTLLKSKL